MPYTDSLSDRELLVQFENCSLPPEELTHEVMLKISWILIRKYGVKQAIVKNIELKQQFFIKAMNSDKFNKTLTKAYTEILHHFMELSATPNNFDKVIREFPRLKFNFQNLVKTHYGYNILKEHRKEEPKEKRPILFNC
ncbi:hypothetical protein SAMN05444411_104147 [Lutibacter oricola]|uniref:Uncharacterized protein n=1 Tax=Lutibacter oricola TaxID=762486 RepID=A0A1H3AJJ7_9FLAO|nr:hypothetical protein [Lutibacter oricola]SDX29890.1 hypothetical protein SAMN05444411_104147 [Lutibacter oricola]